MWLKECIESIIVSRKSEVQLYNSFSKHSRHSFYMTVLRFNEMLLKYRSKPEGTVKEKQVLQVCT